MQVDVVNAVVAGASRPLNWASFTVPQARDDASYFAPLSGLVAGPETELYFALVPYHPDDQAEGTTATQIEHVDAALAGRRVGHLHRVRDGPRERRGHPEAARPAPRDRRGKWLTRSSPRSGSTPAARTSSPGSAAAGSHSCAPVTRRSWPSSRTTSSSRSSRSTPGSRSRLSSAMRRSPGRARRAIDSRPSPTSRERSTSVCEE